MFKYYELYTFHTNRDELHNYTQLNADINCVGIYLNQTNAHFESELKPRVLNPLSDIIAIIDQWTVPKTIKYDYHEVESYLDTLKRELSDLWTSYHRLASPQQYIAYRIEALDAFHKEVTRLRYNYKYTIIQRSFGINPLIHRALFTNDEIPDTQKEILKIK